MRIIYKYPIIIHDHISIEMPQGAKVLTVQMQRGIPCIWATVDPDNEPATKYFRLAGTGHPITERTSQLLKYIGSFQMEEETLIFHLFEIE